MFVQGYNYDSQTYRFISGFFATNITLSDESLKTVNLKVNRNYFYIVTNSILYFVKNGIKMGSVTPFKMLFN